MNKLESRIEKLEERKREMMDANRGREPVVLFRQFSAEELVRREASGYPIILFSTPSEQPPDIAD